jgi:hypothetical protein
MTKFTNVRDLWKPIDLWKTIVQHLDVLPTLGEILRRWNIKLFWCPNHFQASQQTTGVSTPGRLLWSSN